MKSKVILSLLFFSACIKQTSGTTSAGNIDTEPVTATSTQIPDAAAQPVRLYPSTAPGEKGDIPPEKGDTTASKNSVKRISNVSVPTITILPASKSSSGAAMLVCPGGAYNILAYEHEGTEICSWLNSLGITAVLLKYRVPRREGLPKHAAALQDAQRAISYIRANSKRLNINPERIGVIGFSAGAHLSAMLSTAYNERTYPPFDDCDTVNMRPNFCLLVYPAYLDGEGVCSLAPEVKPSTNTPPTLLIQTQDDTNYINSSLSYYYALKELRVPVTMHLYPSGGHGYGLRNAKDPVREWPRQAETWLRSLSIIK
jgi:acetyl esterase/lipase